MYLYIVNQGKLKKRIMTKAEIKKGQIVNVIYNGIEEFAEVLNVYHYENYSSILTNVLTDTKKVKHTFDLPEILSIHSN